MRKLKYAWILPGVQLLLVILEWRRQLMPGYQLSTDTTARRLCFGINAPALAFMALAIPWDRTDLGFYFDKYLFFIRIFLTWYLVGRALDGYLSKDHKVETGWLVVGKVLWNLILIAFGLAYCIGALSGGLPREWKFHPEYHEFIILGFGWAFALVVLPAGSLLCRVRRVRSLASSPLV
jgi:hypothetical protein